MSMHDLCFNRRVADVVHQQRFRIALLVEAD
jgi:hypothetical protein